MRFGYRVRQFWHTLTAAPVDWELDQARQVLSPPLMALFLGLQASEQAHSLSILYQLCEEGDVDENLQVAALLHDVGKSRYPLCIWERVLIVLCKAFFPERAKAWGRAEPKGWRRPFVVAEQHADWGAELAANAGASPLAVSLIRRHHDRIDNNLNPGMGFVSLEDQFLYRLQKLDNES